MKLTQGDIIELYEANIKYIYRFFFYKTLNVEISEDLTSKTFLKFVKKVKDIEIESPKAFLIGIARHVLLDYLRSKYKRNELPLDEETVDSEVVAEFNEDTKSPNVIDLLAMLLPKLPEKQALVLKLRFLDKLSIQEIAAKINKDPNYVSTTQKRAFHSLKKLIECTDGTTNILEEE